MTTTRPPRSRLPISLPRRASHADPELHAWMLAIRTGVVMTLATCAAIEIYAALTWDRPDRIAAVILAAVGALGAIVIWLLPLERICSSSYRSHFLAAWSAADVALIAALSHLDLGARSPFALLFFLTLTFASLFYPRRLVVAIGLLNVIAFLAVGMLDAEADSTYLWFFATCLGATALMCAWQASTHERQRCELMKASRTDPLTGSLNRRGFQERIDGELDRAQRGGRAFGLVLLDLDAFKDVNDEHGHAAGDELLVWVARAIEGAVRPMDSLGRLGGDEFAVLLAGAGRADVEQMGERIRSVVCERVACSVGGACFPADGRDAEEVLSRADSDLYASKRRVSFGRKDLAWATAMADAADARMGRAHSAATAAVAAGIAARMGWDESQIRLLRIASMLHDVGKVGLSERVLQKAGPLDDSERAEVERHPAIGAEIVARIDGMEPIVPWIRHSHERFDGSGYPDELAGEAIPQASRIIFVADALDVMQTDLPYGRGLEPEDALAEIQRCSGSQFDPACVAALEEVLMAGEGKPDVNACGGAGANGWELSQPLRGA